MSKLGPELTRAYELARAAPHELPRVRLRHARQGLLRGPNYITGLVCTLMLLSGLPGFLEAALHMPPGDVFAGAVAGLFPIAAGVWLSCFAVAGLHYLYRAWRVVRRP
jgi:hypothetical protein